MANSPADSGTMFLGFSHQDAAYLARLRVCLAPDVRSGAIPLWDDTQLLPGDAWKRASELALEAALLEARAPAIPAWRGQRS
jgi:hypothetical protein